jgi:tetratricopeptide (TPR) repeat protein
MTQPVSRIRRAESAIESSAPRAPFRLPRWAAAAPAIVTIGIALLVGIAAWAQRPEAIRAAYQRDAEVALSAADFKTARVCYERLLQASPDDPALLLGLAKALQGMGQLTDTIQLLGRLAPADAPGYAPAQLFVAQQIIDSSPDPKSLQLSETHLRRALQADPRNVEARSLLNRIYANSGRSLPLDH